MARSTKTTETDDTADILPSSLDAVSAARQDAPPTQNDTNREERNVRRMRFRQRPTQKTKATGRPELQPFADALEAAMKRAGVTPSELARRTWGTTTDSRGYTVAKGRDRVGSYLNGHSYPEPENLQKLADALDVPVEELAATRPPAAEHTERQNPRRGGSDNPGELILTAVPAKPGRTRLRIDREMNWKLAAKIHELIREAEDRENRALAEDPEISPVVGSVIPGGKDTENNSNPAS